MILQLMTPVDDTPNLYLFPSIFVRLIDSLNNHLYPPLLDRPRAVDQPVIFTTVPFYSVSTPHTLLTTH